MNRIAPRLRRIAATVLAGAALALGAHCAAQSVPPGADYPRRQVTLVVPFPPGGGVDLTARLLAEKLTVRLGQRFLLENRPGVGGLAGANAVAKSAPDGYMLLVAPNTIAISPHILAKGVAGGVDILKDLVPIVMPASVPMLLVVNPQLGAKTPAELVALAQRNPGLPYGSAGNGSPMHFAGEMFKKATGVDMQHVPYKGVGPSVTDAVGGQVKVLFTSLGSGLMPLIRAGKLVPIAVTEKRRTAFLPELPTLTELGIPGVEVGAWYAVMAPTGTPALVISRLNREINAVLEMPDVRDKLTGAGIEVRGGSAEALAAEIQDDYTRYGRLAREFSISAD